MANHKPSVISFDAGFMISLLISIFVAVIPTSVHGIGVCYGRLGDNLPPPADVVALYKSNNIDSMRIYEPNNDVLRALSGSNIQLTVGVPNGDLPNLASNPGAAADWVQRNVRAFTPGVRFLYIAVGNELIPEDPNLGQFVLPAMQNIQNALSAAGLQGQIKVSTAVSARVLGASFPPSAGAFSADAQRLLNPVVQFLARTGSPLLFNVYPYFAYADNPGQISLAYALFTAPGVVVQDGPFAYRNLFDAMVDAAYAALERVGAGGVRIVVSETGWPSRGAGPATVDNARTYNQNLIRHVGGGTPRRPGAALEAYIFAMFNENQKSGPEIERNFGLFFPNKQPVYPISFRSTVWSSSSSPIGDLFAEVDSKLWPLLLQLN